MPHSLAPAVTNPLVLRPHPFAQDPGVLQVRAGQTLSAMLRDAAQGAELRETLRVEIGGVEVPRHLWARVRPKAGTPIHVTAVPRRNSGLLQAVLLVVVAVFAWYAAPYLTGAFGLFAGASTTLVASGLYLAGSLLVNALVPPPKPPKPIGTEGQFNALTGSQNSINPYGPIPCVIGESRLFPPHAAMPYSQSVGSDSYQLCMFDLGYGDLEVSDIRIGDTPIASFEGVQYEITDTPTLYTSDVAETAVSATLTDGDSVTRTTAPNVDEIALDLVFPQGLFGVGTSGKSFAMDVLFTVEYRAVGSGTWLTPASPRLSGFKPGFDVRAENRKPFAVGAAWDVPNGQYEVRVTRNTTAYGSSSNTYVDVSQWTVLRSITRTNPSRTGTTKLVMRIKATDQLNGTLQSLSCFVQQKIPAWNGTAWLPPAPSTNTGWIYHWLLAQCPAFAVHVPADRIDLDRIAAYAAFCDTHELGTRMVLDARTTARALIDEVLSGSLAAMGQTNGRYSVVFDDGEILPTMAFTPLDSRGFTVQRTFAPLPHALKVRFRNPQAGWEPDEIVVLDDGYSYRGVNARGVASVDPEPTVFETLELRGACLPEQAWRLGRYQFAQGKFRPNTYGWETDIAALGCVRGDCVTVAHDVTEWGVGWGRVVAIEPGTPNRIVLDERVPTVAGESYTAQVRRVDGSGQILATETYPVTPQELDTNTFECATLPAAAPGDVVVIGRTAQEAVKLLLTGLRPQPDLGFQVTAVAYDARVAPYWAGPPATFTSEITGNVFRQPPPPPDITVIITDPINETPDDGGVTEPEVHVNVTAPGGGAFRPVGGNDRFVDRERVTYQAR